MRVLFTIIPAPAHLYPIIPLAQALQGAGHEVCVASHPGIADAIKAAGLTAVAVGEDVDLAESIAAAGRNPRLEAITEAMRLGETEADVNLRLAIRFYLLAPFANYYEADPPKVTDDLVRFAESWRPDLVLWDPLFFPAPIAARKAGAAHARLMWGLDQFGWARERFVDNSGADLMAELMEPTLERYGDSFDEELLFGQWTIDPMPPKMRMDVGTRTVPMRWVPYTGVATYPDWLLEPIERPRVCLTLGMSIRKFFAGHSKFPIRELLDSVAELDAEIVATWGDDQLELLGKIPDNVRTIDYIPLNLLLPTCQGIVHHGGAGTFAAAVAHRVPQFFITGPGGDNVDVARYTARHGAGIALIGDDFVGETFAKDLMSLVTSPQYREGADGLYRDMLAMPSPNDVVPVLEKLTAERKGQA